MFNILAERYSNGVQMATIKLLKTKRDYLPTQRKSEYQNIYQDKRWKKLQATKKKWNPLCERCESLGKIKQMDEVHHKIPFDSGRTDEEIESLAFDYENLESLCVLCHKKRHIELKT